MNCLFPWMQKNMEMIDLPVSIGEAISKLTILDIKLQKITDSRKLDIQVEFNILSKKLGHIVKQYGELYQVMKNVNLLIWDTMDTVKNSPLSEEEYIRVCKECVEYNHIRFRVKNKINYLSNPVLQKQKSKAKRAIIHISNEVSDIDNFIRPIKYLSFLHDTIVVLSNNPALHQAFTSYPDVVFDERVEDYHSMHIFPNATYTKAEIYSILEFGEEMVDKLLGPANKPVLEDIKEPFEIPILDESNEPVTKLAEIPILDESNEPVTKLADISILDESNEPVTKLADISILDTK